ncbi:THxN family PEP-CTERM protein [Sedimentitalea nanhaiensis]|uniref:PEP-CTERM protein-sorting domain-containing protein n=1 Tax=Sedimentitalea nanhaiensis TaxID=999627 RepID=A0A1I6ZNB9_9RHOB|nr:PEP-CTERM domain protein [Sedimentitalea nanhaiensis]SFT64127.1 PEP-CTERM protein-sorting domain-containing protein [Sedimentitalea nanhaiensis]
MSLLRTLGASAALTLAAGALSAASLSFEVLESRFYDAQGGNVRMIADTFAAESRVRWGQDGILMSETSGYSYENRVTPFQENENDVFAIGAFRHFNKPINQGTSITSVNMAIRGLVSIDGGTAVERIFDFQIAHTETPNSGTCAFGGANGQGVNANGCADQVVITSTEDTDVFQIGDQTYTLNILGFAASRADAEGGLFDSAFLSPEGGVNRRILAASFQVADIAPVPVPASIMLTLSGLGLLGGMGAYRRRRKAS